MARIECFDLYGNKHPVPPGKLPKRVAAYGLFLDEQEKLILQDTRSLNGWYWFLGGEREKRESLERVIVREAREEVGAVVKPDFLLQTLKFPFLYKGDQFCQQISHFYVCELVSMSFLDQAQEKMTRVGIWDLTENNFHPAVRTIITSYQQYLRTGERPNLGFLQGERK